MKTLFEINSYVATQLPELLKVEVEEGGDDEKFDNEVTKIFELDQRPRNEITLITMSVRNQINALTSYLLDPSSLEDAKEKIVFFDKCNLILYKFLGLINETYF